MIGSPHEDETAFQNDKSGCLSCITCILIFVDKISLNYSEDSALIFNWHFLVTFHHGFGRLYPMKYFCLSSPLIIIYEPFWTTLSQLYNYMNSWLCQLSEWLSTKLFLPAFCWSSFPHGHSTTSGFQVRGPPQVSRSFMGNNQPRP